MHLSRIPVAHLCSCTCGHSPELCTPVLYTPVLYTPVLHTPVLRTLGLTFLWYTCPPYTLHSYTCAPCTCAADTGLTLLWYTCPPYTLHSCTCAPYTWSHTPVLLTLGLTLLWYTCGALQVDLVEPVPHFLARARADLRPDDADVTMSTASAGGAQSATPAAGEPAGVDSHVATNFYCMPLQVREGGLERKPVQRSDHMCTVCVQYTCVWNLECACDGSCVLLWMEVAGKGRIMWCRCRLPVVLQPL